MSIHVRAYKLFYKYLFSYIFILLVPLIILGAFIYVYFLGIIKEDVISNNMNKLDHIRYVIDDHLKQIRVISDQIYIKNMTPFFFEDNPLMSLKTIDDLKNYTLTNNFISDILMFNHNDQYIYSSTSSYKIPLFFEKIYNYEQWDENSFIHDMNIYETPVVRPMESILLRGQQDKGRFTTLIYPLSSGGAKPNQTVLFLIAEKSFQNLLKDNMKDYGGNTLIMDSNNHIVTALKDDPILQSPSFQNILNASTDELNQTVTLEHVKYIFSIVVSTETGWKYITLVPVNRIMEKVTSLKLIFMYILAFIILISCGAIYYLMLVNYKPILLLKKFTEKIWKDDNPDRNELTSVQGALEFLNNRNTELYSRLEDYEIAAKEYMLFQLIRGKFKSREDLQQKAHSLGLTLTKSWMRVITLKLGHIRHSFSVDSILELIENSLPDELEGYARDHMDQENIVLIIASDEMADTSLECILASIQSSLKEKFELISTVGVGRAYQDVSQLPKSYIESMTAIDYRLVKGTGQIIFSYELETTQSRSAFSSQFASDKLKIYIKQGDLEQIDNILQKVIHFLKQDKPSMFEAKLICFEIINAVVLTIEEMNKQQPTAPMNSPDVFLLFEYETVDELVETVKKLSNEISSRLQTISTNHKASLIEQMKDYLKAHYSDCDFMLQQMAEYFNMSQASLSQYFKEHTGSNVLDFETNLKLEKAKQLLISSHLPIKDLSLEVGYYNVNSFIRRFKQVIGITPGEFRKQFQTE
ncbi:helix-turn-helix domain-containing protein [Paenibacillus sp. LMG 31458]|uniref:Helix-turn-helix domain-containing protein n=1 Tax=Paenibacillus phytorum TaxID=2654977 RepID=A0ABX1Y3P5_9BACL|nr:helix-turn-helix domain-containing protein [Paenibacillus phytorum]NOU75487.1 helix-turn-helix domain-containing protein [Paenibacillus phytorum]